jgi:hypothetical protein
MLVDFNNDSDTDDGLSLFLPRAAPTVTALAAASTALPLPNPPAVPKESKEAKKNEWVQCESCFKWRRLPSSTPASSLPDEWRCTMNEDAARNTCDAPEERLVYGTGSCYGSVEHEDRSVLPTEADGISLVMSERAATGYRGVFLSNDAGELPFRVEYGAGLAGEVVPKSKGNRKTKHFATNVEAAVWYARNVFPLVAAEEHRKAAAAKQRKEDLAERALAAAAQKAAKEAEKAAQKAAKEAEKAAKAMAKQKVEGGRASATNGPAVGAAPPAPTRQPTATTTALVTVGRKRPRKASEASDAAMEAVRACLASMRLDEYSEALDAAGFDDLEFLCTLSRGELTKIGREYAKMKPGHAAKFADKLSAAAAIL